MPTLRGLEVIELGIRPIRKFYEHPISTYAAALAYRALFGLFPFILIVVVLAGALGVGDLLERTIDQASARSYQQVPQQLEPVVERGREQLQPLQRMVEQAQSQAGGALLTFGVALALWSTSALASTLTQAFNTVYEVPETRRWWRVSGLALAFGPVLAFMVIVSIGLMLVGPRLVEGIAKFVGLDELFVSLWGWLRFPVALSLLAVALVLVYRFGPDVELRFRSVVVGAALAAALWAISSVGFSFYLANFANYGVTYGSLGAAVGLLFYLYLCASVVLLGAEVNAAIYYMVPEGATQGLESVDPESTRTQGGRVRDV